MLIAGKDEKKLFQSQRAKSCLSKFETSLEMTIKTFNQRWEKIKRTKGLNVIFLALKQRCDYDDYVDNFISHISRLNRRWGNVEVIKSMNGRYIDVCLLMLNQHLYDNVILNNLDITFSTSRRSFTVQILTLCQRRVPAGLILKNTKYRYLYKNHK